MGETVDALAEALAEPRRAPPRRGLRRVEHVATEIGTPPQKVALTWFGDPKNVVYVRVTEVESSWVSHVMLIQDKTTGRRLLGVRFLDGYACVYLASTEADYIAMLAAPSKGKHIWAHWYGMGKRRIVAATTGKLSKMQGAIRVQGKRRRSVST